MPYKIEGTTYFTAQDCNEAGYHRWPMICRHCGATNEMVWHQAIKDACCKNCGTWDLDGKVDINYSAIDRFSLASGRDDDRLEEIEEQEAKV